MNGWNTGKPCENRQYIVRMREEKSTHIGIGLYNEGAWHTLTFGGPSELVAWRELPDGYDEIGCAYCKGKGVVSFVYHPTLTDIGIQAPALYCPMCGRRIVEEEGEVKE